MVMVINIFSRTAYKRLENFARYAKFIIEPLKKLTNGYSPFPIAVIIHLTYRCNLDCFMCCQHIKDYSDILPSFPNENKDFLEIKTDEWKKIILNIKQSFPFKPFLHFSGGEPLLYYGIRDLIKFSKEEKFNVSLISNGFWLENFIDDILNFKLNRLHISIDGPEEIHDKIRGRKFSYKRAVESLKNLVKMRERRKQNFPHITINCTITKENYNFIKDMLKVKEESKADHLTFQHPVFFDKERDMVDGIDVQKIQKDLYEILKENKDVTLYAYVPKKDGRNIIMVVLKI